MLSGASRAVAGCGWAGYVLGPVVIGEIASATTLHVALFLIPALAGTVAVATGMAKALRCSVVPADVAPSERPPLAVDRWTEMGFAMPTRIAGTSGSGRQEGRLSQRPVPRSWLRKFVPGSEQRQQRQGRGGLVERQVTLHQISSALLLPAQRSGAKWPGVASSGKQSMEVVQLMERCNRQ